MSVYAKITLNTNVRTIIDRIVLFVNGASYETADGKESDLYDVAQGWVPNSIELRADLVRFDENGEPLEKYKATYDMIQRWIKNDAVNSYLVISDYEYKTSADAYAQRTKTLKSRLYIRDVYGYYDQQYDADGNAQYINASGAILTYKLEDRKFYNAQGQIVANTGSVQVITIDHAYNVASIANTTEKMLVQTLINEMSAKDDHFMEIDINNSGIKLKRVLPLNANSFFEAADWDEASMHVDMMTPPTEIVFHDPYNPADFTAYGGTWASAHGSSRHNLNSDGSYTVSSVLDILPTRNYATFTDGDSSDSTGVQVSWDMSEVKFVVSDQDKVYYIKGYCANETYGRNDDGTVSRIKATLEGGTRVIDATKPAITLDEKGYEGSEDAISLAEKMLKFNVKVTASNIEHLNNLGIQCNEGDEIALDLSVIDPAKFDAASYLALLPKQFEYTFKDTYQTRGTGVLQVFTTKYGNDLGNGPSESAEGEDRTYIYKRMIFNDLEWSLGTTDLKYSGGATNLSLKYRVSGGVASTKDWVEILVPVTVTDRTVPSFGATIQYQGGTLSIEDGVLKFDSAKFTDPSAAAQLFEKLTVNYEDETVEWPVINVNASSLNSFDPESVFDSSKSEQNFDVYYTIVDKFGGTQVLKATFVVLSSLFDRTTIQIEQELRGYWDEYIPFSDDTLAMPESVYAYYLYEELGYTTLYLNDDYVIDTSELEITYNFDVNPSDVDSKGAYKMYVAEMIIYIDDITQDTGAKKELQRLDVIYKVYRRDPFSVRNIVIHPYTEAALTGTQTVVFDGGAGNVTSTASVYYIMNADHFKSNKYTVEPGDTKTIDGVECYSKVVFVSPSFTDHSMYHLDVILEDKIAGTARVSDVRLEVKVAEIIGLKLPTEYINQYYADYDKDTPNSIEWFLNKIDGAYIYNNGSSSVQVSVNYFEIVEWYYGDVDVSKLENLQDKQANSVGLSVNKTGNTYIYVKVQGGATDPDGDAWVQWLRVDLKDNLQDLTISNFEEISDGVYNIDPSAGDLPDTLTAIFANTEIAKASVPVRFEYDAENWNNAETNRAGKIVPVVRDTTVTGIDVEFANNARIEIEDITYYLEDNTEISDIESYTIKTLDKLSMSLPATTKITYNGTSTKDLDIYYTNITFIDEDNNEFGYSDDYSYSDIVAIKIDAKIGDESFGYIKRMLTINVQKEVIKSIVYSTDSGLVTIDLSDSVLVKDDYIKAIDPYKDIKEQLLNAIFPNRNSDSFTVVTDLRTEIRFADLLLPDLFEGLDLVNILNGYTFEAGAKQFGVGTTSNILISDPWSGTSVTIDIQSRSFYTAKISIEPGLASGMENPPSGNVYSRVDFDDLDSIVVQFINGRKMQMEVIEWLNTDQIVYNYAGGIYTVYAVIANEGSKEITRQEIPINVWIKPAVLDYLEVEDGVSSMLIAENKKLTGLIIDPLVGIPMAATGDGNDALPAEMKAYFKGADGATTVKVDWNPLRTWALATLAGGTFNVENNAATVVTVYYEYTDDAGNVIRTAEQSIELPVTIKNRTVTAVSAQYNGEQDYTTVQTTLSDDLITGTLQIEIDPYSGAYSETFGQNGFAYLNKIKITTGGDEREYDLSAANYQIYDADTGYATNLKNLYTGRSVIAIVNLNLGSGNAYVAKDAKIRLTIYATILNMTYVSGLDPQIVDPYGIDPTYKTSPEGTGEGTVDINTQSKSDPENKYSIAVKYDRKDIFYVFEGDKRLGSVNYTGGLSRLYADIGNEYGGLQRIIIPITYIDRTISTLFDESETTSGTYGTIKGEDVTDIKGFIIDPYLPYPRDGTYYPQTATVRFVPAFAGGNAVLATSATYTGQADSKIKVEWDDEAVSVTYRGGAGYTVTATVKTQSGSFPQQITYPVKVLNRTVTSTFTEIFKDNKYATGELKIKPYDFINDGDLSAALAKELFKQENIEVTLTFNEGDDIKFMLGLDASNIATQPYAQYLTDTDKALNMTFKLDVSRSLSYKGGDIRFILTVPGFAMGLAGRQNAKITVLAEEQYIKGIKAYVTNEQSAYVGQYLDYIDWIAAEYNIVGQIIHNSDATTGYYSYSIPSPYYFITMGGIPLPDKVTIYVSDRYDVFDINNINSYTAYAGIDLFWTNASSNFAYVYYNKAQTTSSFQIDMDYQSFSFNFNVTEWKLNEDILFDETARTYYEEQIILLPHANTAMVIKTNVVLESFNTVANSKYTITFNNNEDNKYTFEGISGGGTYYDSYNKWNFEDVNFDESGVIQYATLILGGKGGQEIRWAFYASVAAWVNQTIPTVVTLRNEFNTTTYDLPQTVQQLFAGGATSDPIPVTYAGNGGQITIYNVNEGADQNAKTSVQVNNITKVTSASGTDVFSSARNPGDHADYSAKYVDVGYIEWQTDSVRAYPSSYGEAGGKIYFVVYDDTDVAYTSNSGSQTVNNVSTQPAYLYHPDYDYAYQSFKPSLSSAVWKYPSKMYAKTLANGTLDWSTSRIRFAPTATQSGQHRIQEESLIISLKVNTKFDVTALPVINVRAERPAYEEGGFAGIGATQVNAWQIDFVYTLPWQVATVYKTARTGGGWSFNAKSGIMNFGQIVNGGIAGIDTSTINQRYTIVLDFLPFTESNYAASRIVVAIDIVA
ncbi:MAG: hypothetical protein LBE09_07550 [Christensenellaceae bacterium]|jgi:hypothetical protein|nr:hypothetical protein [Christensenellaceae bacterium]